MFALRNPQASHLTQIPTSVEITDPRTEIHSFSDLWAGSKRTLNVQIALTIDRKVKLQSTIREMNIKDVYLMYDIPLLVDIKSSKNMIILTIHII